MKYEAASFNTKKMFSEALKSTMLQKPLSKISITELAHACGVNRKTFYYHFESIYDLLKWTLQQDSFEIVKSFDLLLQPRDAVDFVLDYSEKNRHILNCVYDSMGREEMRRFFYDDFNSVMNYIIDETERVTGTNCNAEFKKFLSDFYAEAIAGQLINLFSRDYSYDRKTITDNILLILGTGIQNALLEHAESQSRSKQ